MLFLLPLLRRRLMQAFLPSGREDAGDRGAGKGRLPFACVPTAFLSNTAPFLATLQKRLDEVAAARGEQFQEYGGGR